MSEFILDDLSQQYTQVEYDPVDIECYREGNTGIPYLWSFSADQEGPHLMICAIMHGNEIAGAAVLDRLLKEKIRPLKGRLSLCFGNPKAYSQFDKNNPTQSRFVDQDINRIWGKELLDLSLDNYELRRARELREYLNDVDFLLDIHTMQADGPAVALIADRESGLECAKKLTEIPFVLTGKVHEPESLRLRDLSHFGVTQKHAAAIQIEAGQHWKAETVDVAEIIAREFLEAYGLAKVTERKPEIPQKLLRIVKTLHQKADGFHYSHDIKSGDFFPDAGTILANDGDLTITTPEESCYFLMPVHFRRFAGPCGRIAVEVK